MPGLGKYFLFGIINFDVLQQAFKESEWFAYVTWLIDIHELRLDENVGVQKSPRFRYPLPRYLPKYHD